MSSEKEDFWVIYGRWACQITLHQIAKEERQLPITKDSQRLKKWKSLIFSKNWNFLKLILTTF